MLKENVFRKWRIILSRIYAGFLAVLIIFSTSKWETIGIISTIFFLLGILLVGIATVGRIWCALYISGYKSKTIISTGPYSLCRNPLYFFSFFGSLGVGLATETLLIPALIMIGFVLYYPYVIKKEENKLKDLYGKEYTDYCDRIPSFIPSFSHFVEPEEYIVRPKIFRKNIFDALGFIWIVGILELIEGLHEANILPSFLSIF